MKSSSGRGRASSVFEPRPFSAPFKWAEGSGRLTGTGHSPAEQDAPDLDADQQRAARLGHSLGSYRFDPGSPAAVPGSPIQPKMVAVPNEEGYVAQELEEDELESTWYKRLGGDLSGVLKLEKPNGDVFYWDNEEDVETSDEVYEIWDLLRDEETEPTLPELEDELTDENGKVMLNLPPGMRDPIVRAQINTKSLALTGGKLELDNFQVHLPGLLDTKVPAALVVRRNKGAGLSVEASLTENVSVGENVTVQEMAFTYKEGQPRLSGKATIDGVPGLKPIEATIGYNSSDGVTLDATVQGKPIALPAGQPIVTGGIDGTVEFKKGSFTGSSFRGAFDINLPQEKEFGKGKLDFKGKIGKKRFDGCVKLMTAQKVNSYLELKTLLITITGDQVKGQGAFEVGEIGQQISFAVDAASTHSDATTPKAIGDESSPIWGSLDYGFDWGQRGFYLEGTGNVALTKNAVATGQLRYLRTLGDGGSLKALLEVKRVPILKKWSQEKTLIEKFEKRVPLYRLGGLGGVFAEGGADLGFNYEVGPVELSADVTASKIDLSVPKADFDPVNVYLHGSAAAGVKGTPWVGLGAWFLSRKLVNLKGGVRLPVSGRLRANLNAGLTGLKLVGGRFIGPKLTAEMGLAFGMKGAVEPYAQIYALNGLFDDDLAFDALAGKTLVSPRKVLDLELDLAKLKQGLTVVPQVPESLDQADEDDEEAKKEGQLTPTVPAGFKAGLKGEVGEGALPAATPNLRQIRRALESNPKLKKLVAYAGDLKTAADKLSWPLAKLVDHLEQSGVTGKFRNAWGKIATFGGKLAKLTGLEDYQNKLDAEGLDSEVSPESQETQQTQTTGSKPELLDELLFELGDADIRVQVRGTHGTILFNMLEADGLKLKKTVPLKGSGSAVTGASLEGSLKLGDDFAELDNIKLGVKAEGEKDNVTYRVDPSFAADLQAKTKLDDAVVGNLSGNVTGTIGNTQTKVQSLQLDGIPGVNVSFPNPLGGSKLVSEKPPKLVLRKGLDDEWRVASQGLTFLGGRLQVKIDDYENDAKKGVSGKGHASLLVAPLGHAVAKVVMKEGAFESLEFLFVSKRLALPSKQPVMSGQLTGGFAVKGFNLDKPNVKVKATINHPAVNGGEPVDVASDVSLRKAKEGGFEAGVDFKLKQPPVELIRDLVRLDKLKLAYDKTPGSGLSGKGAGWLRLPGVSAPVPLGASCNKGNFTLSVGSAVSAANCKVKALEIGYGSSGWAGGADVSFWNDVANLKLKYAAKSGWEGEGKVAMGKKGDRLHLAGEAGYSHASGLIFGADAGAKLGPGISAAGTLSYQEKNDKKVKSNQPAPKSLDAELGLDASLLGPQKLGGPLFDVAYSFPFGLLPFPGTFIKFGAKLGYGVDLKTLKLGGTVALDGIDLAKRTFARAEGEAELGGAATTEGIEASVKAEPHAAIGVKALAESVGKLEGGLRMPVEAAGKVKPKAKGKVKYGAEGNVQAGLETAFPLSMGLSGSAIPYIDISAAWGLITFKKDLAEYKRDFLSPKEIFTLELNLGDAGENDPQSMAPKKGAALKDASGESVKDKDVHQPSGKRLSSEALDVRKTKGSASDDPFSFSKNAGGYLNQGLGKVRYGLRAAHKNVEAIADKIVDLAEEAGAFVTASLSGVAGWVRRKIWSGDHEQALKHVNRAKSIKDIRDYEGLRGYWKELPTPTKLGLTVVGLALVGGLIYLGSKVLLGSGGK